MPIVIYCQITSILITFVLMNYNIYSSQSKRLTKKLEMGDKK